MEHLKTGGDNMPREKKQYSPNVSLGGEIVKEAGRENSAGELGNDKDIHPGKNRRLKK
jgi:hypothetical protein